MSRRQFRERYDDLSIRDFLRTRGWSEAAVEEYGIATFTESTLATSVLQEFQESFSSVFTGVCRIAGGMDLLPRALFAKVADLVYLGHEVERIVDAGDSVCVGVKTLHGRVEHRADYAVCTLPFSVLRGIDLDGPFSSGKRRAIRQLHYDAATKVYLQLRSPTWLGGVGSDGGVIATPAAIRRTQYPRHDQLSSERHLLLASYTWGQDALQWAALSEEVMARRVIRDLETRHPDIGRHVEGMIAYAWSSDQYALGAYALAEPGQARSLHDDVLRPEGRVMFAGEHCSNWPAWIEGAVESAYAVAESFSPRRASGARAAWL